MSRSVENQSFLLCRLNTSWCALEMQGLGEVMRPQPVDPIAGFPPFVEGVSIIRGEVTPVVDLTGLLCGQGGQFGALQRFVTIHSDGRQVALRVDEVAGIQVLEASIWQKLPALVEQVQGEHLTALASLGGELLLLLRRAQLLSPEQWARVCP